MKGQETLIAMRKGGHVVGSVWLDLDPDKQESWRTWTECADFKAHPDAALSANVQIEPGESISRLDLRFLVGLTVWVHGSDLDRVQQLHKACAAAGAKRVLSAFMQPDARGEPRTAAMFDTAGIFQGAF
jgi:hypothetical protein